MSDTTKIKPIEVREDSFKKLVLESDKPVVVDFWAKWCRPCVALAPSLEQLCGDFAGRLSIAKVDVEAEGNQELSDRLSVKGLPSLVFFHKGVEVKRLVGAMPRARLQIEFEQFLAEQGLAETVVDPDQQKAFDAAVAIAEEAKQVRSAAAGAAFRVKSKDCFDALDEVRKELLKALADELPEDEKATALRGAAGEFDEEVYKLFARHRRKIDDEERFKHIADKQNATIELLNSGDGKKNSDEMFAEIAAAEAEFNDAVELARRTYLTPPQA